MKPLKIGLRAIIAVASLISFLGGWVLFSRAGKPQPLFSSQPATEHTAFSAPTLQPIPSLNDLSKGSSNLQPLPSLQNSPVIRSMPRMRTMGS
jgi:hypothetical protein